MSEIDDKSLQDVAVCQNCEMMKIALDDNAEELRIGDCRRKCMHCKRKDVGIYKFDGIYTALQLKRDTIDVKQYKRNVGKKPTAKKRYGKAVKKLRAEGYSLRKIADTLQISVTTVQKILKD
jgi:hypothetical protein